MCSLAWAPKFEPETDGEPKVGYIVYQRHLQPEENEVMKLLVALALTV